MDYTHNVNISKDAGNRVDRGLIASGLFGGGNALTTSYFNFKHIYEDLY